ncbi:MAG: protein kinase domain-containing protein [Anaerolineales bacterium]
MPEWIGKTIGKVRIEKLLARGGMAEVYLASHLTLERPVAIKLLHSYIEEDPSLLERFHREAKVVAGLRHSNIVQIFDFDTEDGHPYIVMEFLKGPTLATYLRNLHQRKKRIPPHQVARLLKGLTAALDYAHGQGVIHRDIKPGNIILHNKTDEIPLDKPLTNDVEAVVTDFGLVRVMDAASQTASGFISGTPAYMSPEQARGDQTDHRTDIYSLGVVLYEMLAGRVPFAADSTMTVLHMQIHTPPPPIPGIPAEVQAVMDRALLKNPDDRYQTSREMAIDYYLSIGMTKQAETIREPYPMRAEPIAAPAPPKQEPTQKQESLPKSEPQTKPEPAIKPPTPKPARSRTWIGVGLLALVLCSVLAFGAYQFLSNRPIVPTPTEALSTGIPNPGSSPVPSEAPALPEATRMVNVPAGTYQVGKGAGDNFHSASQSITLPEFWIDQYLVTNQEFQQFMVEWQIPSGQEKFPVMGVQWDEADSYCKSLNKRLPGEAEWEAAGRGPGENPPLYPWGPDPAQARGLPNDPYEVGSLAFNRSTFEVYDLIGNIYEWVGEPYYASVEAGKKLLRGVRASVPEDLTFRAQVTIENTNYSQYAGFRCATTQVR